MRTKYPCECLLYMTLSNFIVAGSKPVKFGQSDFVLTKHLATDNPTDRGSLRECLRTVFDSLIWPEWNKKNGLILSTESRK